MPYHIVTSSRLNFRCLSDEVKSGLRPKHSMIALGEMLGATIHSPTASTRMLDRLRARLVGSSETWALAREVSEKLSDNDVVFATGEDVGFPLAAFLFWKRKKAKLITFVHNVDRPRGRLALRLLPVARRTSLFVACASHQTGFLAKFAGVGRDKLKTILDSTDLDFFSPGVPAFGSGRVRIVSVGLEARDYVTLAAATEGDEFDVSISGFSANARVTSGTFPDVLPPNMTRKYYEWAELRKLYQEADVIVVSAFPSNYAAGVQALMEGLACGRPVVASRTVGLQDYLDDEPYVVSFQPRDPADLSVAINRALGLKNTSAQCRAIAVEKYDSNRYVSDLAEWMKALSV